MDLAYDHIVEQSFGERSKTPVPSQSQSESQSTDSASAPSSPSADIPQRQNLQTELQDTFKAFSNSAWGKSFGGFWGNVKKQSESYYEEAVKEVGDLGADALKEFEGLRNKVVNVSVGTGRPRSDTIRAAGDGETGDINTDRSIDTVEGGEEKEQSTRDETATLEENETFIARFKTEAAKRLKEVQKAEDAADDALLRFGTNIRNFLRDAVAVSAPEPSSSTSADGTSSSTEVLFESKDATTGKRVAHASRFDAQLYVIHTSIASFTRDPEEDGDQFGDFKRGFDVGKMTETIARDLERYPELRVTMEKLVPEQVEYKDFWARYYFLRRVVEAQEEKRKEILKASTTSLKDDEDLDWGDDDDDEDHHNTNPKPSPHPHINEPTTTTNSSTQSDKKAPTTTDSDPLKSTPPSTENPNHLQSQSQPRRSHDEKSIAGSDASYDLVSGTTSRAPGSPLASKVVEEESDEEEDWE